MQVDIKRLTAFLRMDGWYGRYQKNIRLSRTANSIKGITQTLPPVKWITNAFNWDHSIEGRVFWTNINMEWLVYVEAKSKLDPNTLMGQLELSIEDNFEECRAYFRNIRDAEDQEAKRFYDRFHHLPDEVKCDWLGRFLDKYSSSPYKGRYHRKYKEPAESMKWRLYEYGKRNGVELTGYHQLPEEMRVNSFISEAYHIKGVCYVARVDGQGSYIIIERELCCQEKSI